MKIKKWANELYFSLIIPGLTSNNVGMSVWMPYSFWKAGALQQKEMNDFVLFLSDVEHRNVADP